MSDFLRHTRLYSRKVCLMVVVFSFLRTTSNVSVMLQYDLTTSITSGIVLLFNVLYVRYRRELFINKSVLFLSILHYAQLSSSRFIWIRTDLP